MYPNSIEKTVVKKVQPKGNMQELQGTRLNMSPETHRERPNYHQGERSVEDFPSRPYPMSPPDNHRWKDQHPVREVEKVTRVTPGRNHINRVQNSRFNEPVKSDYKNFGAQDINDLSPEVQVRPTHDLNRHTFFLRKAEGTITTMKRIGSSKNSGKIAIGFTSGDLIFTDLN